MRIHEDLQRNNATKFVNMLKPIFVKIIMVLTQNIYKALISYLAYKHNKSCATTANTNKNVKDVTYFNLTYIIRKLLDKNGTNNNN